MKTSKVLSLEASSETQTFSCVLVAAVAVATTDAEITQAATDIVTVNSLMFEQLSFLFLAASQKKKKFNSKSGRGGARQG